MEGKFYLINNKYGLKIFISSMDRRGGKKTLQPCWMKRTEKLYLDNYSTLASFGRSFSAKGAGVYQQPHKVHASPVIQAFQYILLSNNSEFHIQNPIVIEVRIVRAFYRAFVRFQRNFCSYNQSYAWNQQSFGLKMVLFLSVNALNCWLHPPSASESGGICSITSATVYCCYCYLSCVLLQTGKVGTINSVLQFRKKELSVVFEVLHGGKPSS